MNTPKASSIPGQPINSSPIRVAVAGNPNTGKSTLINALAGTNIQVGNWPGVTVEKREAVIEQNGREIHLVDLPGIYSLNMRSPEEKVAMDFLTREPVDLILNVIDATNLERNLILTLQLIELEIPMILAINICDEAQKKGIQIDHPHLEQILGTKVLPTIATQKRNITQLKEVLFSALKDRKKPKPWIPEDLQALQKESNRYLSSINVEVPKSWLSLRIMDHDEEVCAKYSSILQEITPLIQAETKPEAIRNLRYKNAEEISQKVSHKLHSSGVDWTERFDRILLHSFWGLPIFFLFMWVMFKLTFDLSGPFVDWIDQVTSGPIYRWTALGLNALSAPDWMISLGTDGIIGGVGFVLAFTPVIFTIMFFISFLEASGYMARAAFLMDRHMQKIGLPGKAFIPLLLGFGCNVPSIYATRTLPSLRDRILTALITPLMSCGARLPVYILFIAAFFPNHSGTVLFCIYFLGLILAVFVGFIFSKTILVGDSPFFLMELPPYRFPMLGQLLKETWEKGKHFLEKAGTFILGVSILVWFLFNLPWGVENPKDSLLGKLGGTVAPVLSPLGFGTWEAGASLITGIVAKEIVVGTMGEIYIVKKGQEETKPKKIPEELKEIGFGLLSACKDAFLNVVSTVKLSSLSADPPEHGLVHQVKKAFTPLQAISFMVFVLLYMPCAVTGIAMKQEFGTWKWFGVSVAYGLTLAWVFSFTIYQGGLILGFGG